LKKNKYFFLDNFPTTGYIYYRTQNTEFNMNETPFEKANNFGTNLAAALALHHTLKDLDKAKTETKGNPEAIREIEIGTEILFQALITLGGENTAQA
tara:strand:- start:1264 stop:1554 length:291 start_codon:yes stop_codon:yes gene_type:complete